MSLLLWSKEITLVLLVGSSCNANGDCKTIPSCEMDCDTRPKYRCNRRGIIEVPSFPEATENIDVSDNTIGRLGSDTFADYSIVFGMDLSNNFLASLPVAVFMYNTALEILNLAQNMFTNVSDELFANNKQLRYVDCSNCFDCDCLSISTYKWITKRVTDLQRYNFTCRNGVTLPNTVVNCSGDSSYTSTALVIGGMASSITLISAFMVLRKFIDTTSRIKQSRMTDTEHNNVISEGIDFIKTLDRNGQMGKKYYNIPPKCHINMIHDGIDFIKKLTVMKEGIQPNSNSKLHNSVFV
ncbi:unnamed protein product [Mytilus edulis]|uniref:Uncharacterized protein n=1 Tax=Mytilus edulis TaxID=6550 RepID=A0A8S3RMV2_MYTED|nr:unnamed protein product [Mytilus edulis]